MIRFGLDKDTNLYTLKVGASTYTFFLGNIEYIGRQEATNMEGVGATPDIMIVGFVSGEKLLFPSVFYEHIYESWVWYLNGSPEDAVPHELNRDFHD